jgi:hypothetical protein
MTMDDLIRLTSVRAAYLSQLYASHAALGDVEAMARVQAELATTQATLTALQSLS